MSTPILPIPYYRAFVFGTPTIPDIYWNSYSYEERIKKLCIEYEKLTTYLDEMTDKLNDCIEVVNGIEEELNDKIEQMVADGAFDDIISSAVEAWIAERGTGSTYGELKAYGFVYGGE